MANDFYLLTENVKVFPSTRRVHTQTDARLITEQTISGLINQLVDSEGFVITESYDANKPFEFNVFGYYFYVNEAKSITDLITGFTSGNTVYAVIKIATANSYHELIGQDDVDTNNVSRYQGLLITDQVPSAGPDEEIHYLAILQYENDQWVIPNSSKIKFTQDRLDIIDIDGGIIQ